MFKTGDRVVCIDIKNSDYPGFLIKNKTYIVLSIISGILIAIKNNNSERKSHVFGATRFISLTYFRKMKIKKLKNLI
jgi:hypothetical protein